MADEPFQWPGRRVNDPAHDMLVAFFVMDIQHNSEWAHELSDRLENVKSGNLPVWERIGNAYRLEISAKGALIEDLVDEEIGVQTFSLKELGKAVEAWIRRIEQKH